MFSLPSAETGTLLVSSQFNNIHLLKHQEGFHALAKENQNYASYEMLSSIQNMQCEIKIAGCAWPLCIKCMFLCAYAIERIYVCTHSKISLLETQIAGPEHWKMFRNRNKNENLNGAPPKAGLLMVPSYFWYCFPTLKDHEHALHRAQDCTLSSIIINHSWPVL